jgi:histidine triad (HIT) family protein
LSGSASSECIFCKIVAGDIPATIVHEDEDNLAFLDINPLSRGHLLVIPKAHYERLADAPAEVVAALGRVVPRLVRGVVSAVGAEGLNIFVADGRVAGQEIPHVHFHLVPRSSGDGVRFRWRPSGYGESEIEEVAEAIRAELAGKGGP